MNHYCTLFDKNYLNRGLALYRSLAKEAGDFTLWILVMDDETYTILAQLHLPHIVLITLVDFEDRQLKKIKPTRTPVEYFWTLTPSLPLYILKKYPSLPMITYLDADLFFFSSPSPIFDEFGQNSILLTEHRYSPAYQHFEKKSGQFNVQFLTFRNNRLGQEALRWWRARCLEWCFNRFEDGKFGDQKYLDDWLVRFRGVHVLDHLGAGVAPWNVHNYPVTSQEGKIYIASQPLIFYHFHAWLQTSADHFEVAPGYRINRHAWRLIYQPYLDELRSVGKLIHQVAPNLVIQYATKPSQLMTFYSILTKFVLRSSQP